jgi:deferrochelatase/peroxidase EfeB
MTSASIYTLSITREHPPYRLTRTSAWRHPKTNNGAQLLRRSYSHNDGIDADTGQIDAGLLFLCFQRDPHRQFAAIQHTTLVSLAPWSEAPPPQRAAA